MIVPSLLESQSHFSTAPAGPFSAEDLLIQNSFEAFNELVQASTLPLFNSDCFLSRGYETPGRISVPITDEDAHATYYLTCLTSEQKAYRSIFNAVRGNLLSS